MSKIRKIFSILIWICGMGMVCIVVSEIVLRYIYRDSRTTGWSSRNDFVYDSHLIYRGQKNIDYAIGEGELKERGHMNTDGFRDVNFGKKSPDVYRIAIVGDSFTFGHGIKTNDQTYPSQLQKELQRTYVGTRKIQVYNFGVKGYAPDQEYRFIMSTMNAYKPDMVVWTLNNPGDFYNTIHSPDWPIPALYDVRNTALIPLNARLNWMYVANAIKSNTPAFINQSYLFNFIVYQFSRHSFFSQKPEGDLIKTQPWAIAKWRLQIDSVLKMTKEKNMDFIIVVVPYPSRFTSFSDEPPVEKAYRELFKIGKEKKIPIIDIFHELPNEEVQRWKDLYFKTDTHPNEYGSLVFARIIAHRILPFIQLH